MFDMPLEPYCPGSTVQFQYVYYEGTSGISSIKVFGPLENSPADHSMPYTINSCNYSHKGRYVLKGDINGATHSFDTIFVDIAEAIEFEMDITSFCPGGAISFQYHTVCPGVTSIYVRGPLENNPQTYTSLQNAIPSCTLNHTGNYVLGGTIQGAGHVFDTVYIAVFSIDDAAEFTMPVTYFCPGDIISFDNTKYKTNCSNYVISNLNVYGPNGNGGFTSISLPGEINPCNVNHSGNYKLRGNITDQNGTTHYNYVFDEIELHVIPVNVTVTPDNTTIYAGQTVQLQADGANYYVWSPTTWLSNPSIANPIASPATTTTYYVTGYVHGDNRVVNGDFEDGNTGFVSDYTYRSPSYGGLAVWDPGYYTVHDNAYDVHHSASYYAPFSNPGNHGDPGCGSGKYMIVNGSGGNNVVVWEQVITVRPGVDYAFSANVCSLGGTPYSKLQFSINGNLIGSEHQVQATNLGWETFYALWTSGPTDTQATIRLVNTEGASSGNDFGVDNITFYDLMTCFSQTSAYIEVIQPISWDEMTPPSMICDGGDLDVTPPDYSVDYHWHDLPEPTGWHWEIAPSPEGPFQTFNITNVSETYNGWYLCYVVTFNGQQYYSPPVRIMVVPAFDVEIEVVEGETTICPGETVELHANVGEFTMNYLAVGDILCTDGSFEKPANWPVQGKTAKGIVFYVDNTQAHGWAVALTQSGNMKWSTSPVTVGTDQQHWRDAIRELDGYTNTLNIRNSGNSDTYPAAWSVGDFENEKWYLPTAGQLNLLFGELVPVNESLTVVEGDPIVDAYGPDAGGTGTVYLWSSTEKVKNAERQAYVLEVLDGHVRAVKKDISDSNTYCVRAVVNF